MTRTLLILAAFGAVALVGIGGEYLVSTRAEPGGVQSAAGAVASGEPAARVAVAAPVRKTLRLTTLQPGQIQAFEQTPLFVKFPAYVQKLYADIGDRVEQDQPLADLWIPELEDEGRQKEALVAQAKAGIEQAAAAIRAAESSVETARAGVRESKAGTIRALGKYNRWKAEHARIVDLAASQSVDRKLVDETQYELSSAEASREEAEAKVASAEAVLADRKVNVEKAKADLTVAIANVESTKADLARVKSLLQYMRVRMPYAGIVTERNVNRGDFVQPATMATAKPLFIVARGDMVRIFVDVPEMESSLVEYGAKGNILVQALRNQKIEGTVTRTSWALGPNRTLRTELDVRNRGGLLRPGMYANVEIVLKERPNAITLPLSAVIFVEKQAFCYCVENDRLVRRPIGLGLQIAQDVEVISGLNGREMVVQSQVASLREGQTVEIAQTEGR